MSWNDILGQEPAKRTLSAHLAAGTIAGAYLFAGPEGVGKRRLALELAKALNCASDGVRPCDVCATCQQIGKGIHPDLHRVAPSGASHQIKIGDERHVLGRIAQRPYSARVQIAILEHVEQLTEEAANSLLKSLEEPTATTCFLLTTEQLSDCLLTIVSRCQVIRCHPLSVQTLAQYLVSAHGCEPKLAAAVAPLSRGSAARAIELAGRWTSYQALLDRLADPASNAWLEPLPESRQDVVQLLDGMTAWLRDLAVTASADASQVAHQSQAPALRAQAQYVETDRCLETAFELAALRGSLEQFVSPRLVAALAREKWLTLISV
ncbi:MAG: DNA polymerase III subunit delta' [Candidatus Omnitrophota bacterium]|nr:DNA polymerase III subunit delta' [Candidatus Omnitrophota bacterium]